MAKYDILISSHAKKEYQKLDTTVKKRIDKAILQLEINRAPQQFKPLMGSKTASYRLRVGDWRVLYDVYDEERTVLILRIGHRKEIYR